jgi:ATP-dependent phosphoenolpyruvate carboxykinase
MTLLIAANVAALGFLALVELSASARAQGRPRATYTAATGRVDGFQPHALFIVDETSQEVIAVQWDPQAKQIKGLGYRSLANDTGEILRPRSN